MFALSKNAGGRALWIAGVLFFSSVAEAETLRGRGTDLYYRGHLTESVRVFERAIRAAPLDPIAYLDAGVVYRDIDDVLASRKMFERASRLAPEDAHIRAAFGWASLRTGRYKDARAAFNRALQFSMDHPQSLIGLAYLDLRLDRPKQALAAAERLIAVRPDITLGHVLAGRAHQKLGRTKKAIEVFTEAFKSDNSYSEVRLWLGPLYKKLRRYNDAWRQYARVLYVSPRHAKARKEKGRLATLLTRTPEQIIPERPQKRLHAVFASKGSRRVPIIRVAIGTTMGGRPAPKKIIAFRSSGPFEVRDPETGKLILTGPAHKTWIARRVRKGRGYAYELRDHRKKRRVSFRKVISIRPKNMRRHSLLFQRLNIARGTVWEFKGDRQLKGIVEIRSLGSRGLYLVNQLPLEDYTYGVINQEMPVRYPKEALKAQAVIARNHALQSKSYRMHRRYKYDLCDGQHCQVYSGISGESRKGRKAVEATRGLVLKYKGRMAHTPYSSNCGGNTQDSGEVRGWSKLPYLHGRQDDLAGRSKRKSPWELERWLKSRPKVFCNIPKYMHPSQFRWARIISANELGDRIRRRSKKIGLLRKIRILKRSRSGNVNKIEFRGTRGRYVVDREQRIRGIMGVGSARNTNFTIEVERNEKGVPTDIFIYGGGWGHSIGLCQIGAAGRATAGQSYKDILAHYYRGTKISSLGY